MAGCRHGKIGCGWHNAGRPIAGHSLHASASCNRLQGDHLPYNPDLKALPDLPLSVPVFDAG
jgi:hypothetical protein